MNHDGFVAGPALDFVHLALHGGDGLRVAAPTVGIPVHDLEVHHGQSVVAVLLRQKAWIL